MRNDLAGEERAVRRGDLRVNPRADADEPLDAEIDQREQPLGAFVGRASDGEATDEAFVDRAADDLAVIGLALGVLGHAVYGRLDQAEIVMLGLPVGEFRRHAAERPN